MRHFQLVFLVLSAFLIVSAAVYAFDELPDDRMSVTINGGDAYIETLNGERFGFSPFTQEYFSEIPGILKSSGDGKTMIEMPADQLYGFWLERPEADNADLLTAEVRTAEWRVGLGGFRDPTDFPDLLVNPKSSFSENGPVFDKITVYAGAEAFPAVLLEFPEAKGTCRMRMRSGFDIGTADPAAAGSPAELVVTYYPEDSLVSVWVVSAAAETEALFSGGSFLFGVDLSCENQDQSAGEEASSQIAVSENGIFFIDLDDFRSGGEAYFEGDLDGDEIYEVEPRGF